MSTTQYVRFPSLEKGTIASYSTFSLFPPAATRDGQVAIALDTKVVYLWDQAGAAWKAIAEPNDALSAASSASINLAIVNSVLSGYLKLSASAAAPSGSLLVDLTTEADGILASIQNAEIFGLFSASAPLSFSNGAISISQASGSSNGYLSSSDWTTFNNKQNALTPGNITSSTTGVTITGGSAATVGPSVAINIATASGSSTGLLTSSDWTTFNNKQNALSISAPLSLTGSSLSIQKASGTQDGYLAQLDFATFAAKQDALTFGNLSETGSAVLTITGGNNAVVGSGVTIQIKKASASQDGYLAKEDFAAFNAKQNYAPVYDQRLLLVDTPTGGPSYGIMGPILAGTSVSLPLGQTFVGAELEVYLNGLLLWSGDDYTPTGTPGAYNAVQFAYDLVVGDQIRFRIARVS